MDETLLFVVDSQWGRQPVHLTAWRAADYPADAPVTSVHIVAFEGDRILLVQDKRGVYGFPGGRLDAGETREQALAREVYEEANAFVAPDYRLFAVMKIEYPIRLPNRVYPHDYSYMAFYVGSVTGLDPFDADPDGSIIGRALMTEAECAQNLPAHDQILLREALAARNA